MGTLRRLAIVYPHLDSEVDGIRDHGERLCEALLHRGIEAFLCPSLAATRDRGRPGPDALLIQYMPFAYGRWGFAPSLLAQAGRERARDRRPVLALMAHELYVPPGGVRNTAMGLWQRLQLLALARAMDVLYGSIEAWAQALRAARTGSRVEHLPVGSNLPDRRSARCDQRRLLGADENTLVLASFGRDHPSHLRGHVRAAVNAVAGSGRKTVYLNLGADPFQIDGLSPNVQVLVPGREPGNVVAARLAAADLFLAAREDGVSARRGSLMAALQHGVATVATEGAHTDSGLGAGMVLVDESRPRDFAEVAHTLARDVRQRSELATRGRLLYEQRFDWATIAERLQLSLEAVLDHRHHSGGPPR